MSNPSELVDRWRDSMGSWDEDDPDVLAWMHKQNQPVVADVNGQLRLFHTALLYPSPLDDEELSEVLDDLGEPSVMQLSSQNHRFDREMFEWEYEDE